MWTYANSSTKTSSSRTATRKRATNRPFKGTLRTGNTLSRPPEATRANETNEQSDRERNGGDVHAPHTFATFGDVLDRPFAISAFEVDGRYLGRMKDKRLLDDTTRLYGLDYGYLNGRSTAEVRVAVNKQCKTEKNVYTIDFVAYERAVPLWRGTIDIKGEAAPKITRSPSKSRGTRSKPRTSTPTVRKPSAPSGRRR